MCDRLQTGPVTPAKGAIDVEWTQWLVPVALVGAMFLLHRGGCGGHGRQREGGHDRASSGKGDAKEGQDAEERQQTHGGHGGCCHR